MKTILQVEDDPNDVFFLKIAMKKAGVANPIQVASDGQQAIDYLRGAGQFADRDRFPLPGLVLLDMKLPHVMGLDVLKWIRQHLSALVVIMLTSSQENADIATAYRLGANGFLVKPSEANKLEDIARAIKDFWLTHNALPEELLPESPMEGVVSLAADSFGTGFAAKHRPPVNGTSREGGPAMPRQPYEKNPRAAAG